MGHWRCALVLVLVWTGCGPDSPEGLVDSAVTRTAAFQVGLPIYSATFWDGIEGLIRPGDLIEFQIGSNWDYALGRKIAQDAPGVRVAVHRRCSGALSSGCTDSVSGLPAALANHPPPPEVGYVLYDFEPGYEPEFTQNEVAALRDFSRADALSWAHRKRVFATPFNPFRGGNTPRPWSELQVLDAMPHSDVINVQLEGIMSASGVAGWCCAAEQLGAQFASAAPGRTVFVQVSFNDGSLSELIDAGKCVKRTKGLGGLYVWNGNATLSEYVSLIRALR